MRCGREKYSLCLEMAHLVNLFLPVAHKNPKCVVIMNSKTNFVQNKPINERKEMFVDADMKNKYCSSLV